LQNDRLHSTEITDLRLQLYNQSGRQPKYKIQYTDLMEKDKAAGLKVELFLPLNH